MEIKQIDVPSVYILRGYLERPDGNILTNHIEGERVYPLGQDREYRYLF